MGKVCVITGVGPGNGASFSRRFTAEGYTVVMLARNAAYLEALADEIPGSVAMECDVRKPEAVKSVFARIHKEIGAVDTLVYNAGAGEWAPIMETSMEGMLSSWTTNALGLVMCAQQVIPAMTEKGEGNIMVIGATASLRGGARSTAFSSAKAAQRSVAQSMARDLGPKGIHVGDVVTSVNGKSVSTPDQFIKVWNALNNAQVLRVELVRNEEALRIEYPIVE